MKTTIITYHGEIRAQERGISFGTLQLVTTYGHKTPAKQGLFERMIRRPEAEKLLSETSISRAAIECTKGVSVITAETDQEVTVVTATRNVVYQPYPHTPLKALLQHFASRLQYDN